jgi:hypothetical protein
MNPMLAQTRQAATGGSSDVKHGPASLGEARSSGLVMSWHAGDNKLFMRVEHLDRILSLVSPLAHHPASPLSKGVISKPSTADEATPKATPKVTAKVLRKVPYPSECLLRRYLYSERRASGIVCNYSDGFVFTHENAGYLGGGSDMLHLLKWKYLAKNTVDFLVREADHEETKTLGHSNRNLAILPR